ncbi:hypothetical protein FJZ19_00230 [Candidatus Pacearchaeota archaeon]|nr:hypothetical protein [Candidatus Pacearchaeota archaeon]
MIRKIENKEETEKKRERRNKIIVIIFGIILLLSSAGYAFFGWEKTTAEGKVSMNGLTFTRQGDVWTTEISSYKFYFRYLPNETEEVKINKRLQDYIKNPLYLTGSSAADEEIARNLAQFAERINLACYMENCTENLPEKNCSSNMIIIKEKPDFKKSVYTEEDNCVFIFSNNTIKAADSFIYRILQS